MRRLIAVLLLSILSACARAPAPAPVAAPPPPPLDADSACRQDLERLHVVFEALPSFGDTSAGCVVANPVRITSATIPWNRPTVLSCPTVSVLAHYETEVLQPAAQAHFGQAIRRINHLGTYSCRVRRNTTEANAALNGSRGGRMSEHSKGRAIDLGSFELADGTIVSVKNDWRAGNQKAAFLHDIARAACSRFSVVLTPNYDRFHQDHIHLDIGPYGLCGI